MSRIQVCKLIWQLALNCTQNIQTLCGQPRGLEAIISRLEAIASRFLEVFFLQFLAKPKFSGFQRRGLCSHFAFCVKKVLFRLILGSGGGKIDFAKGIPGFSLILKVLIEVTLPMSLRILGA